MIRFRVLDVETTGTEPTAEVIELAHTDVLFDPETRSCEVGVPTAALYRPSSGVIPPETQAVHHITWAMVKDRPIINLEDYGLLLTDGAPDFLVAHNAAFERQWITDEIVAAARDPAPRWIDTFKAALRIWTDAPAHNNQALRYWLEVDVDPEVASPPHRAGPDTYVTAHILAAMLAQTRASHLVGYTMMGRFYATCPLGAHRGKAWSAVPHDFLVWMTTKAKEMEDDLRAAAREEISRRSGVGR